MERLLKNQVSIYTFNGIPCLTAGRKKRFLIPIILLKVYTDTKTNGKSKITFLCRVVYRSISRNLYDRHRRIGIKNSANYYRLNLLIIFVLFTDESHPDFFKRKSRDFETPRLLKQTRKKTINSGFTFSKFRFLGIS